MEKRVGREFLIIVPGARALKSRYFVVEKLILFMYHLLSFHPIYPPKAYRGLIKRLSCRGRKTRFFRWSGGFLRKLSVEPAAERLARLIRRKSRKYRIKIICFSIGAGLAQLALHKIKNEKIKIDMVVQAGAFNYETKASFSNAGRIINLFSDGDKFVIVGMDILEPLKAGQKIYGRNARNINIPGFEHENFYENCLIKKGRYKNKRIFDLYKEFLK